MKEGSIEGFEGSGPETEDSGRATPILEPCLSCKAKCCINFRVNLTSFDIKRIVEGTGLNPEQFCELVSEEEVRHAEKSSIFLRDRKTGKVCSYLICLKRRRNGHCMFLGRESSSGQGEPQGRQPLGKDYGCSIHAVRPMVCRCYPFKLGISGKVERLNNYRCPRGWSQKEILEGGYLDNLEIREKETEEYAKHSREWNARVSGEVAGELQPAGGRLARVSGEVAGELQPAGGRLARVSGEVAGELQPAGGRLNVKYGDKPGSSFHACVEFLLSKVRE